jgi:hypothetical protein
MFLWTLAVVIAGVQVWMGIELILWLLGTD